MRPTIQMIFRVNQVRERENGGLLVLGWVSDSRDSQGKWHTVDVSVFLSENNQSFIDAAMQLMENQRVFVSGTVINGSYMTRTGTIRDRYTIIYPTSFVPLDMPAVTPEEPQEEQVEEPVVAAAPPKQAPKPQPEPQPEPQPAGNTVEMEGVARYSKRNNTQQQVGTALRPRTVTVPRASQAAPAPQPEPQTVDEEEDDLNYDPFAEP